MADTAYYNGGYMRCPKCNGFLPARSKECFHCKEVLVADTARERLLGEIATTPSAVARNMALLALEAAAEIAGIAGLNESIGEGPCCHALDEVHQAILALAEEVKRP